MRGLVRQLLGRKSVPNTPATLAQPHDLGSGGFDRLNSVAPLKAVAAEDERNTPRTDLSFVCREAILNRDERISGYEFALHSKLHSRFAAQRMSVRRVYDDLLIRSLAAMDIGVILGHRMAVVDLAIESFANPQLQSLASANTLLMIHDSSVRPGDPAALAGILAELRERGFLIGCLLNATGMYWLELVPLFDLVKVRASDFDGLQLVDLAKRVRAASEIANPVKLLACGLSSLDEFRLCYQAGYDHFQGPFVTSREQWHPPRSEIDRTRVIRILNRLRQEADNAELAGLIRQDPLLSYKLLRYLNSPALGLARSLTQVDHGLAILGRDQLYRWLSLLLFDVKGGGFAERVLFEQALVRARFMEQLAKPAGLSAKDSGDLFMTGLFSLLDQILGQSIGQVLESVSVPDPVRMALIERDGPLAPFLGLSLVSEHGDPDEMALMASACRVSMDDVNREMTKALAWTEEISRLTT